MNDTTSLILGLISTLGGLLVFYSIFKKDKMDEPRRFPSRKKKALPKKESVNKVD